MHAFSPPPHFTAGSKTQKFLSFSFFDCAGSPLLCAGFLQLQRAGATLQLRGLSFVMQRRLLLWSTGSRAPGLQQLPHVGSVVEAPRLQGRGSIVVALGLSCSLTSGIFPDQGSNPCLLYGINPMSQQILNHWTTREVLEVSYVLFQLITGTPYPTLGDSFWICVSCLLRDSCFGLQSWPHTPQHSVDQLF